MQQDIAAGTKGAAAKCKNSTRYSFWLLANTNILYEKFILRQPLLIND